MSSHSSRLPIHFDAAELYGPDRVALHSGDERAS